MVMAPRMGSSTKRRGDFDWMLALSAVALAMFGSIMIYTATKSGLAVAGLDGRYFFKRQATFVVLGPS